MELLTLMLPLALLVVCSVLPLLRFSSESAARHWALAWVLLYVDGFFWALSSESTAALVVAQLAGLAFSVALFAGARALNEVATPRWLIAGIALAGAALVAVNVPRGQVALSAAVGPVQGVLLVWASASVWRHARRETPLERWLAAILMAIAVNGMAEFLVIQAADRLMILGIWLALGLSTAVLQVGVLADRAQEREALANLALDGERSNLLGMLDALPVGILLEDSAGYIRLLNPPLAEQLGIADVSKFRGRHASELVEAVRAQFAPSSEEAFDRVRFTDPADVPRDLELRLDAPRERVLLVSVLSVDPRDGRTRGRVWMSRDVTDERRMLGALQEAERMETVGTLAGGLAHDFNNQLTAILGNATLMRDALPEEPRVRRRADDLVRSAEHCAELTAGLLAFARRGPTATAPVDVHAVFADAERLVRPSLDPGVKLEIDVADGTPPVAADASELRRVLTNLLLNARDATVGREGTIRVSASRADASRVEIRVEDGGVGMEESVQKHIFDPFFTTRQRHGGTGLGLAIVYGITQAHGAEIDVRSRPDEGTRFRLHWPAAEVLEARPEPALTSYRSSPATILLAEDEPAVRRLVRQVLEGGGYEVFEASDGAMAVRVFEEHRREIDLALFDLSMPKATGLEALAEIRARAHGLPALLMSGHPTRDGGLEWPSDVLLIKKPCSPAELLGYVDRALHGATAAASVG